MRTKILIILIMFSIGHLSDAQNGELFAKMLIAQIFASALGIYGIIIGIIVSNFGQFPN